MWRTHFLTRRHAASSGSRVTTSAPRPPPVREGVATKRSIGNDGSIARAPDVPAVAFAGAFPGLPNDGRLPSRYLQLPEAALEHQSSLARKRRQPPAVHAFEADSKDATR